MEIVIADGGFGGLYAVMYLDKTLARSPRRHIEVTLISRKNPRASKARKADGWICTRHLSSQAAIVN